MANSVRDIETSRPFANSVCDTKYHKWCSTELVQKGKWLSHKKKRNGVALMIHQYIFGLVLGLKI